MEIIIAILNQDKETLGYKGDTFWTMVDKKDAKKHEVNSTNQIAPHLIPNLLSLLNGSFLETAPKETYLDCTNLYIALEGDTGEQTIIYSLHRSEYNVNNIIKPWIADIKL